MHRSLKSASDMELVFNKGRHCVQLGLNLILNFWLKRFHSLVTEADGKCNNYIYFKFNIKWSIL